MAADAFPSFQVTGAVHHYVATGLPGSGTALYLGTCQATPQIRYDETSKPVMNDITGPTLPAQKVEGGEMAIIAAPLNRFSRVTFNTLRAAVAHGRRGRSSRGGLRFGRNTFQLWQVYDNAVNGARNSFPSASSPLPYGRYWPQVELITKEVPQEGTQDQLIVLTFEAQPYYVPQASATSVQAGEREFYLWSETDGDFPAGVLVPQ